jgi:DNA repair protein RadD
MIELRPYQAEAFAGPIREQLRSVRELLISAPTGAGKGVMIGWMAAGASAKGRRSIVTVPKIEMLRQSVETLGKFGIAAGIIAAGQIENPSLPVQVASVATLTRPKRLERWAAWGPDLVVVDEAHHVLAHSWRTLTERLPYSRLIGFSATPRRLDRKSLRQVFGGLVVVATVRELIDGGWLSPVRVFTPPVIPDFSQTRRRAGDFDANAAAQVLTQAKFVGDVVEHYGRHRTAGGRALGYAANVQHSQQLVAALQSVGFRAMHVDGETVEKVRIKAVADLAAGNLDILFNCLLFSEGLDLPALDLLIIARPTLSVGLYLQMCGRALRPAPGKEFAQILDHCGNALRHGLPDWDRKWSLDEPPRKRKAGSALVRRCPKCGLIVGLSAKACGSCQLQLRIDDPAPLHAEGELVEADPEIVEKMQLRFMSWREQDAWAGADYRRLKLVGEARDYRAGWAVYEYERRRRPTEGNEIDL